METAPTRFLLLRQGRWTLPLVLFLGLYFALTFHSGTWESGDEDRYYTLGLALHRGWGFVNAENPERTPETITPPGYPALVALTMKVTGENPQAVKWTGGLFLLLTIWTVHRLAQRLWPEQPGLAWATFLLGIGCVALLAFSGMLMADLPAMLFGYLALLVHLRGEGPPGERAALLAGVLVGLAYLCRAATLALAGAFLLDLAWRRSWRPLAAFAAGIALAAAPWWFRNAVLLHVPDQYITYALSGGAAASGGGGMMALLPLLLEECRRDLPVFLLSLPEQHFYQLFSGDTLLSWVGLGACATPLKLLFLAVVAGGWLSRLRRPGVLEFFFPAHLLLISAYPRPFYDINYLFPVLPVSAFYFVLALQRLGDALQRRAPAARGALAAGLVIAGCAAYSLSTALAAGVVHARKEWRLRACGPWEAARYEALGGEDYADWIRYGEAGGWVRSNTPPDTLVASRKPKHMFVFSDRRGWRYDLPREVGCTNAWEALEQYPDVVFIEDAFGTSKTTFNAYGNARVNVLLPLMAEHRDRIELLHETAAPTTRVWRVKPAAGAAAAPAR